MIFCVIQNRRELAKSKGKVGRFLVGEMHFDVYYAILSCNFDHGVVFFNPIHRGAGNI